MIYLEDNEYPFNGVKEEREIVRAILLDENNKIVLEDIYRNDEFGESSYYETPGGGINKGENIIDALKREIREELGYEIDVIEHIDDVIDYYNLIYRKNINHYYLAKIVSKGEFHREEKEIIMIQGEVHFSFEDAVKNYHLYKGKVGKLVSLRELPILLKIEDKMRNLK